MTEQTRPTPYTLLDQDETAWLEQTAVLVAEGRFGEIDSAQPGEYLADLARRDRREVIRRLTVLPAHRLKWEHQPPERGNSWQATILLQCQELRDLLESRRLENHARESLGKAHERAVKLAALEMGIEESALPAVCPWLLEEVVPEE